MARKLAIAAPVLWLGAHRAEYETVGARSYAMALYARTICQLVFGAAVLLVAAMTSTCLAAEIDAFTVTHHEHGFNIALDAIVDAPSQRVYAVLSDYARLGRLNPVITAIDVELAPNGDGDRVRSVIKACITFFCRRIVQVEDVFEPDSNTIAARIVPGAGDFESGSCYWRVTKAGHRTRLRYEAVRIAAFWIPPLIGPWAINRTMREQFTSSIATLERVANQKLPPN